MKYSIFILILLLFAGCKKEAENPTGPDENRATGYVRSYVDGVDWEGCAPELDPFSFPYSAPILPL